MAAAVLGLLTVVAGAEAWARRYVADQVEGQLRSGGITGDIEVSTAGGWRPIVLSALAGRGLEELHIAVSGGSIAGMPVERADYVLRDIDGDVSLRTGEVEVRSIGSGSVRIEVAVADISDAVGTRLEVGDGRLVTADGVGVDVTVDGDSLVLGGPAAAVWGALIELPVVDDYLLPCTPRVAYRPGVLVLSCTGSQLPGVLSDPLSSAADPDVAPTASLLPPQSTIVRDDPAASATDGSATDGSTTAVPTTVAPADTVPDPAATVPVVPPTEVPTVPPAVVPPPG